MLYYAFWAGGYFGGPQPVTESASDLPGPQTFREKMSVCCAGCCACMTKFHDTQLCFWSVVILCQVLVLVIFVVSIVMCIFAAVKAFISAGCSEIYVLTDTEICAGVLAEIKEWFSEYYVAFPGESNDLTCTGQTLTACNSVTALLSSSTTVSAVFSFLASLFSLQMLIESAVLHEMA